MKKVLQNPPLRQALNVTCKPSEQHQNDKHQDKMGI